MKFTTWVAAVAIIVLPVEGVVVAVNSAHPSCPAGEPIRMPTPYFHTAGPSWYILMPELERLADNVPEAPNQSPMVICENHRLLGPAHALHRDIAERGQGGFSHWGPYVIFSTTDNSDPNTNGRSYLLIKTDRP